MNSSNTTFTWGKHKGKTINEINNIDKSYLWWVHKNSTNTRIWRSVDIFLSNEYGSTGSTSSIIPMEPTGQKYQTGTSNSTSSFKSSSSNYPTNSNYPSSSNYPTSSNSSNIDEHHFDELPLYTMEHGEQQFINIHPDVIKKYLENAGITPKFIATLISNLINTNINEEIYHISNMYLGNVYNNQNNILPQWLYRESNKKINTKINTKINQCSNNKDDSEALINKQDLIKLSMLWKYGINANECVFKIKNAKTIHDVIDELLPKQGHKLMVLKVLSDKNSNYYVKKITQKRFLFTRIHTQFKLLGLNDKNIRSLLNMANKDDIMSSCGYGYVRRTHGKRLFDMFTKNPYAWYKMPLDTIHHILCVMNCPTKYLETPTQQYLLGELSRYIYEYSYDKGNTCIKMSNLSAKYHFISNHSKFLLIKDYGLMYYGIEDDVIYIKHIYNEEIQLSTFLKNIHLQGHGKNVDLSHSHISPPLTPDQQNIIKYAMNNHLTFVSASAGTGKSTTVKGIVEQLVAKGYTFVICSSTGNSVQRVIDVLEDESLKYDDHHKLRIRTVHSLYYSLMKKNNNSDGGKCLYDYIIIDEAGMLNLSVFSKLISCFTNSPMLPRFVVIGDPHQLKPMKYGRPFENLVKARPFNIQTLTKNLRVVGVGVGVGVDKKIVGIETEVVDTETEVVGVETEVVDVEPEAVGVETEIVGIEKEIDVEEKCLVDHTIVRNANNILKDNKYVPIEDEQFDIYNINISHSASADDYIRCVDDKIQDIIGDDGITLENYSNYKFITPTIAQRCLLNDIIGRVLNPNPIECRIVTDKYKIKEKTINTIRYATADPVIFTKNKKYRLYDQPQKKYTVYNGTEGIIEGFIMYNINGWDKDFMVVSLGKKKQTDKVMVLVEITNRYHHYYIKSICLAYCINIHKAQGAEWNNIYLMLDKNIPYFTHKNMMYTAITRAKQRCTVLETQHGLFKTCARQPAPPNYSCLIDLMTTAMPNIIG